jgi:hypothetical protein
MPPERLIGNSDGRPRFPFVNIAHRSPCTPIRNSSPSLLCDVTQTHPIDNPFYPSPFFGLCFNNGGGGALAREGALIQTSILSFEEPVITYFDGWLGQIYQISDELTTIPIQLNASTYLDLEPFAGRSFDP